jgi:hypothetical protein
MLQRAFAGTLAAAVLASAGTAAAADEKYALGMFHFNVQYVAGGTLGFLATPNATLDLDNDTTEDRIITESLEPVVDMYAKHPTWGIDLEMQGYMLEIIATRHPALLAKMRTLAKAKQIDIVSFHYSDQLFIGFPEEDWVRSQALTAAVFAKYDVPLSRTVFCQEGQAAPRMAVAMKAHGYRNMVWPKNLWIFQHGDFAAEPLYRFGDVNLIAGAQGVNKTVGPDTVQVSWTFFDDGELLATGKQNPYFPELFHHKPAEVAAYEKELSALEAQGYKITTVDQYVTAMLAKVTPADPPPLLDGTWQPNSTGGVKRWLGGAGIWAKQERDNHVRTLGAMAHRELTAAETIATKAGIAGPGMDARERLDAAWRLMFLGQVTDASGINPFRGEVEYGISHTAEALRLAREVIADAKAALKLERAVIDPRTGEVSAGADPPIAGSPGAPAVMLTLDGGGGDRTIAEHWEQLAPGHARVSVSIGPGSANLASVRFAGVKEPTVPVGLALGDAVVTSIDRSAFTFDVFHLALPTGWIGLGGGKIVIADLAHVHLAAEIHRATGDVLFEDQTVPVDEPATWVFHVLDGKPEDAVALARDINVKRRLSR